MKAIGIILAGGNNEKRLGELTSLEPLQLCLLAAAIGL